MAGDAFHQALTLLEPVLPQPLDDNGLERLHTHLSLIRQWNAVASLVSEGDVAFLEERHVIDSLSLVPYVLQCCDATGPMLDIGSGGGFPIIPIKCVLPELQIIMVERSVRKVGFLHRVCAMLQLEQIEIVQGSFPEALPKIQAKAITARALERPRQALPPILQRMPLNCTMLCQNSLLPRLTGVKFHVEQVEDAWRQAALRRGELYLIRHTKRR